MASMFGGHLESPRRRRARPSWNQDGEQSHEFHESSASSRILSQQSPTFSEPMLAPVPFGTETKTRMSKTKTILMLFIVATACLLVVIQIASTNHLSGDRTMGIDVINESRVGLRRRLQVSRKQEKQLHYLSFGGPLTYGRGLDDQQGAYPYRLATSVRNVADLTFEGSGPTMASVCTQSIVEGSSDEAVEYDVITLEYLFRPNDNKEAYLSSMALLLQRLRQRYPQAKIVLVQIWTPTDLVHLDMASNTTISYGDWQNSQKLQQNNKIHNSINASVEWTFRRMSDIEKDVHDQMEATMASMGAVIAKLEQPAFPSTIINDWFLEESDDETHPSTIRYYLSRSGHAAVAKSIQEALRKIPSQGAPQYASSSLMFSWGSGDACRLWYETGKEKLPTPEEHSSGLTPSEIAPGSYALEVTSLNGGTLNVHNPFDGDRLVYLTYLTASEMATSNKVYPKTKIKVVATKNPSLNSSTTGVLLDPSHGFVSQHQHHYTRTTAVGIIPAQQSGILEFTTLEEYTVHPFRIVGVSFLHVPETTHVPFELEMFSPRRLSVDKKGNVDDFDSQDEINN